MIFGKKVLGVITARGGSKGVPKKNIRDVSGKPLIAWSIDAAVASQYLDRCILSSDDIEIIQIAKEYGCEVPFIRPGKLATDESTSVDVILHVLNEVKENYDIIVLLQPTSPLRSPKDIDACIRKCANNSSSCVSVTESEKTPYWMYNIDEKGCLHSLFPNEQLPQRRQEAPKVYSLNGAVYAFDVAWFLKNKVFVDKTTSAYIMPKQRSIDIDTIEDFNFLNFLLENKKINK